MNKQDAIKRIEAIEAEAVALRKMVQTVEEKPQGLWRPDADAGKYVDIIREVCGMLSAKSSGDLQQRQAATFAAAVAIGAHMKGAESE